jgi:hypothetical protein
VSPLADTQLRIRDAVVTGDAAAIAPLLLGGQYPEKRFAIHQRNYETSLVTALLTKFPATVWLVGTRFVTEAATRFVRELPPNAPCIAEYGEGFPRFLSTFSGSERVPYLGDFARLEWNVGQASIAIDWPPLGTEDLSTNEGALLNSVLLLQPGLRYVRALWPADELMELYLSDTAPETFKLSPCDASIEVYGARGEFRVSRLDAATLTFRQTISNCRTIGDAAERALDMDAAFDPGQALGTLIAAGLVIAIERGEEGDTHDHE